VGAYSFGTITKTKGRELKAPTPKHGGSFKPTDALNGAPVKAKL